MPDNMHARSGTGVSATTHASVASTRRNAEMGAPCALQVQQAAAQQRHAVFCMRAAQKERGLPISHGACTGKMLGSTTPQQAGIAQAMPARQGKSNKQAGHCACGRQAGMYTRGRSGQGNMSTWLRTVRTQVGVWWRGGRSVSGGVGGWLSHRPWVLKGERTGPSAAASSPPVASR